VAYKQQTTIQDSKTFRIGSVKFEIGPHGGGYTDVGALEDATAVHSWEDITVPSDNAGIIEEGITKEMITVSAIWKEINVANLGIAFAGIGTPDTVAAAPANITDETHVLTLYELTELTYKNGDGTEVTAFVVGNDAAPTITWVRDCDYVVTTLPNGSTAIARAYPAAIETAAADITPNIAGTYTSGSSGFAEILAPGDHITITGCGIAANNGIKTVVTATDAVITVSEAVATEVASASTTITRGGIATAATVYCDYTYTPLTSRTITFGGLTTKSPLIIKLTNSDVSTPAKTWIMWIYKAYIGAGLNLAFPADDDRNPMPCPITFVGKLDVDRASGDQLFKIVDTQDTD